MTATATKSVDLSEEDYDFLAADFPTFAEDALRIRPKGGGDIPLVLNRAQRHLHEVAERQLRERGFVRIIGLKGRQQGFSTYVEGRGYWKTTNRTGYRTFILTHEDQATQNLFGFVKHYHENCPPDLRPETGAANANELYFSKLNSGYKIATAGGKDPGRSQTVQFFHGSEVAFWPNAQKHARGVLQTVPKTHDTEIWLESTSDGPGNYFHQMCMDAQAGKNDYEFVFVPWWWQEEYAEPPGDDFDPSKEERELLDAYEADGLTESNLVWRRAKISELGGVEAFKREYPNSVDDAFAVPSYDKLIDPLKLKAAIGRDIEPTNVRPIWGVDCGRFGDDSNALAKRQGNVMLAPVKRWGKADTMTTVGRIVAEFEDTPQEDRPSDIIVDAIGIGAGVADRLREVFKENGWDKGDYACKIVDVNVGEGASEREQYHRLRDELWDLSRAWCEDPSTRFADDPATQMELIAVTFTYTSAGKKQIESKDELKKPGRLGRSPDGADALNNTFYRKPKPRPRPKAKPDPEEGHGHHGSFWGSN